MSYTPRRQHPARPRSAPPASTPLRRWIRPATAPGRLPVTDPAGNRISTPPPRQIRAGGVRDLNDAAARPPDHGGALHIRRRRAVQEDAYPGGAPHGPRGRRHHGQQVDSQRYGVPIW